MKWKLAAFAILLAATTALWFASRESFALERLVEHESQLRELVVERPVASFLVAFLAYVAITLIPGTAGKAIIVGWLFGIWAGMVIVNFGLTIIAIVTFLISRYLIRDAVQANFKDQLERVDAAVTQDGALYVFALRMMHAPYTMTNYAMGVTQISLASFWWSTQIGLLPSNFLWIYAGTQLPTLEQIAEGGVSTIFSPTLLIACGLLGLVPFAIRWGMRRYSSAAA